MSPVRLSHHLRRFLEYLEIEKGRSPLTVRNYEFYLHRFIDWTNDPKPSALTAEDVRQFRLHLNRLENNKKEGLKKSTQNYHLIALRSFLKYLARNDIETLAPEKIELAKQGSCELSFLDAMDMERLLDAPSKSDAPPIIQARDRAILELFFSTGLRVSELAGLTIDSINLNRDEFSVRGKGDTVRVVFLSHHARQCLKHYLATRDDECPYLFVRHDRAKPPPSPTSHVGAPRNVGAITPRSIERLVHRYSVEAGIPKHVSPHTLRHSFATDLLMNGADIRSVQSLLGHASITTTQIYTHVTNRQLRDVHAAFHAKRRTVA